MSNNIGYHTRAYNDNTTKLVGGSFGGKVDADTIERLVKSHFTVTVKPSGRAVFVDRSGREVSLYLTVDPSKTVAGREALAEYRRAQEQAQREEDAKRQQAMDAIDSMDTDELLAILAARNVKV